MKSKILCVLASAALFVSALPAYASAGSGFTETGTHHISELGCDAHIYTHDKTGAEVVYIDNDSERREFSICFKTPVSDNKGANHVLEHSLLCGSEKYPAKNIMSYVRDTALADTINATTSDDITYYSLKTSNETEYYNLMDIYLNGIFHPLLLSDENIFRQQGIRLEYRYGNAGYNGVVYNELRINSLDSTENSLSFVSDKLYTSIYGETAPSFNSGGTIDGLKELTYEDVLRVYETYYTPSNCMVYTAGEQDIQKTLKELDGFFDEHEKKSVPIAFADTKSVPSGAISEYNISGDTETVDIGFMSSGVLKTEDVSEQYARDIILNIISARLSDLSPNIYTSGGNSGGIANSALIFSEIPIDEKDVIISSYSAVLSDLAENGFGDKELSDAVDQYISQLRDMNSYSAEESVFEGILYNNDPFYYSELTETADALRSDTSFFTEMLKKYFTENEYSKIIVSGNGAAENDTVPQPDADELERIKAETEAFDAWADEPDDPAVIGSIPTLTLDEVKDAPELSVPVHEEADGIDIYFTEKDVESSASLYFPLCVDTDDLIYTQLLSAYMNAKLYDSGITDAYFGLYAPETASDDIEFKPMFLIGLYGEDIAASAEKVFSFISSGSLWNETELAEYIKNAPSEIIASYHDPYQLSYQLLQSSLSDAQRFYSVTSGCVQQGSPAYYDFLKNIDTSEIPEILGRLNELKNEIILTSKPTAEFSGKDGYDGFKRSMTDHFADAQKKESGSFTLPPGCPSAATITDMEDANHFMISGKYDKNEYSGKLIVLGRVLSSKYAYPTLRGKYGAYGAGVSFYETGMICSASGISDPDLALEAYSGMGEYLRNLDMTQKELDAYIVPAVKEFDEYYYSNSEYGAQSSFTGQNAEYLSRIRNEMLSTTVDDLRGYAGLIDELIAQNGVFAVTGKADADSSGIDFAYYGNAETLTVTPCLTRGPVSFPEDTDEYLTRSDAAVLLAEATADKRPAELAVSFTDIEPGSAYYEAVAELTEKGILNGCSETEFMPDRLITRAEFCAAATKYIFDTSDTPVREYPDVSKDDWFYDQINTMASHGYMTGYEDGTMRPSSPITLTEAKTILERMIRSN